MLNNQPVTQVEYILRDNQSPISRTDAKGRITYVNSDFCEAAGFTEDELMGKAHNIVRHPTCQKRLMRTCGVICHWA